MTDSRPSRVSEVLQAIDSGTEEASEELLPLLYEELRTQAGRLMRRLPPGQTLQPTALVHEAYLRLVGRTNPGWKGRAHFFAAGARAMRDILVEQARRKGSLKRGGDRKRSPLREEDASVESPGQDILALDEALKALERVDPEKAKIVQLRFFAGLSLAETAGVLEVSEATIKRQWRYLRAWLHSKLTPRTS